MAYEKPDMTRPLARYNGRGIKFGLTFHDYRILLRLGIRKTVYCLTDVRLIRITKSSCELSFLWTRDVVVYRLFEPKIEPRCEWFGKRMIPFLSEVMISMKDLKRNHWNSGCLVPICSIRLFIEGRLRLCRESLARPHLQPCNLWNE